MKFQKHKGAYIPLDNEVCKVTRMGHILEVQHMSSRPTGLKSITRISKDQYMVNETGEIKDYRHSENRAQNVAGLKRTFANIRRYINNNFTGGNNMLFTTLTYAENMTDPERLRVDCDNFRKRLNRFHPNLAYLSVIEPQARGAWHLHMLLKDTTGKYLYISNDDMARLWGHGYTKTERLDKCNNVGAYVTAYLANIPIEEYVQIPGVPDCIEIVEVTMSDENGKPVTKSMVKGGRCYLYPSGIKICRHSQCVKPPTSENMKYIRVKEIVGDTTPDYSTTVEISDDDGQPLNTISYFQFNLKRHKKQEGKTGNDDTGHADGIFNYPADEGKHP